MKVQTMKSLKMHLLGLLLTAAAVIVGSVAVAQTYPQGNVTTIGTGANRLFVARGIYTSATTAPAAGVDISPQSAKPVYIATRGSVAASATITTELKDGTVLSSQAVAIGTTPSQVSFSAPVPFEVVRTSVTTPQTGSNSVSITVLQ